MDGMNGKKQIGTVVRISMLDRTELAYKVAGTGEPVVFVHGALSDYRTWSDQVAAFSDRYKVISYSRRLHHPCAGAGAAEYTRSANTTDLIDLLDALNIKGAHLIGHSYGASLALLTALRRPDLVKSLVLGEPSPFAELLDDDGFEVLADQKKAFAEAATLARDGRLVEAAGTFLRAVVGVDVLSMLPEESRSVVLDNAGTLLPMLETYYASPRLGVENLEALEVPALIVSGELSPEISRVSNESIAKCLPNSRMVVLRGVSHGLQIEDPEGFNELVLDFLSSV